MALSLGKRRTRGRVGLDLDDGYVAVVELHQGTIARAVSSELPAGIVVDGEVRDSGRLATFLKDFFAGHALPRNVCLGVGNQQVSVRSLELPPIDSADERAAAVRFMAAETIAMPLEEANLDHQVVTEYTAPDGSRRSRVVVVAARRSMIDALVDAVRGAGLRIEGIDLNAFAVVRMLADSDGELGSARVFCHVGDVVDLAVAVGSDCVFARPLTPVRDESGVILAAALAEDIRLSIDFFMALDEACPIDRVMLCGPEASRPGLAEEIAGVIGLPVELAQPLARVGTPALAAGEDPYRHTVAAGLALEAAA